MSKREWSLRSIRKTQHDRARLAAFSCADQLVRWQLEVENFVRQDLFEWRFAPQARENDPRVLLLLHAPTAELIGVAAHERLRLQTSRAERFWATKLEVVAVATAWQGKRFRGGLRASDVLMSGVMSDIAARVPPRFARVMALVHEDNSRSIQLCIRHGFTEELSRVADLPEYRRLLTEHRE